MSGEPLLLTLALYWQEEIRKAELQKAALKRQQQEALLRAVQAIMDEWDMVQQHAVNPDLSGAELEASGSRTFADSPFRVAL